MTLEQNSLGLKKVYICGDSFSTIDDRYPGFHWSEKLRSLLGSKYTVINLAKVGASNFSIYMQVRMVLKYLGAPKEFYVIVNGTSLGRIEARIDQLRKEVPIDFDIFEALASDWRKELPKNEAIMFFTPNTFLMSNTYNVQKGGNIPKQIRLALKYYYLELEDTYLSGFKDAAFIELALRMLESEKVSFSFNEGFDRSGYLKSIVQVPVGRYSDLNLTNFKQVNRNPTGVPDPSFHIELESDHQYIAEYYYNLITTNDNV